MFKTTWLLPSIWGQYISFPFSLKPNLDQVVSALYTSSQKCLAQQKFLFLILKVLLLMVQIKHHNVFFNYTKYKSSSVTLTLV